jgi:hypothetical protein
VFGCLVRRSQIEEVMLNRSPNYTFVPASLLSASVLIDIEISICEISVV